MNTEQSFKDELMDDVLRELTVSDAAVAVQDAVLSTVGENILTRVLAGVFQVLPVSKHDEFRDLLRSGSAMRVFSYIQPYISDFPAFVQRIAADEVAETKKLLAGD